MKSVSSIVLLLLVVCISSRAFSQQRNVVINTNSIDRTVITNGSNVDIWEQLEQERIAAEKAEQARIAAERAEQERIAAEKAEQARIAAENAEQARIAAEKAEQARIAAENAEQAHIADKKGTQPLASPEDIQKCEQVHKQIVKLSQHYTGSRSFNKYNDIYKSLSQTQENIDNLQKIQYVVILYLNSKGEVFPQIEKQLKNTSSMEAEIAVFLSYYKEH